MLEFSASEKRAETEVLSRHFERECDEQYKLVPPEIKQDLFKTSFKAEIQYTLGKYESSKCLGFFVQTFSQDLGCDVILY